MEESADVPALLQILTLAHTDVSDMLTISNHLIMNDVASDRFVTVFFGRLVPRTSNFEFASARHHTAFWARRDAFPHPLLNRVSNSADAR